MVDVKRGAWSPALQLALACCEPPGAGRELRAERLAFDPAMDWPQVLAIARHHRVEAMVYASLCDAGVTDPREHLEALRLRVHALTSRALSLSAESVRIQRLFEARGIPSLLLKGAAIGALAYGQRQLKSSWDIDLLLDPDNVAAAAAVLGESGYRKQGGALPAHEKEMILQRASDGVVVELHWRLHNNRALLGSWTPAMLDAHSVAVAGGTVRTLADEQHYVYLAVHGASHAWFRLKWLADFSWWLAQKDEQELHRFHQTAVSNGAGRCSAQGLLLAHELLRLRLPPEFSHSLRRERYASWLVRLAKRAITSRGGHVELAEKRLLARAILASQLILSDAPGYRRNALAERWRGMGDFLRDR